MPRADRPVEQALRDRLRIATIGYRLSRANAARCPLPERLTGLLLHDQAGYAPAERVAVVARYDLGAGIGVLAVVPGSPAAIAGIAQGDELVAEDGADLAAFGRGLVTNRASNARVEAFENRLAEPGRARIALRVRRGAMRKDVVVTPEPGCGRTFVLVPDNGLDAWSDGRGVAVSTRLLALVRTDDELAFVLAHEMSHNIFGQRVRSAQAQSASAPNRPGKVQQELDADRSAVQLMRTAGFDVTAVPGFLDRYGRASGSLFRLRRPTISARIRNVAEAVRELPVATGAP